MKRKPVKKLPPRSSVPAFDLSINAVTGKQHVSYLKKNLKKAHPLIKDAPAEISIAIVADKEMARLHKEYMNIDGTTDVLTFELDYDSADRITAGEIVICLDEAKRQAQRLKHHINRELLLYCLHGILHLSGYDDRNDADYDRMHRREDRLLKQIGIEATFVPKSHKKVKSKK